MKESQDCKNALDHLFAELDLRPADRSLIAEMIEIYPTCEDQLLEAYAVWKDLGDREVSVPSSSMDASFYKALNEFEAEGSSKVAPEAAVAKPMWQSALKYAAVGLVLLLSGMFVGRQLAPTDNSVDMAILEQADEDIQINVARMTMSRSSTHKMEAIQETKDMDDPSDKIFEALNQVLLSDRSINVRLSAIEAMLHFSDDPLAREYLIKAIPYQESPIVQIALADAMINLEEKESLGTMQEMLESGKLELEVKDHFADAIKILM